MFFFGLAIGVGKQLLANGEFAQDLFQKWLRPGEYQQD